MYFTRFLRGAGMLTEFSKGRGMSVMIRVADSTCSLKKMTIRILINIIIKINPNQDNGVPDSTLPVKAVKNFLQACVSTSTLRNQVFHTHRHTEQTYRCRGRDGSGEG